MRLGLGGILQGGGHIRKEVEPRKTLNVVDGDLLPGGAACVVHQVRCPDRCGRRAAGEGHLHDALEVLRGNGAFEAVLVRSRSESCPEDRSRDDIERIAGGRGIPDLLDIPLKGRPHAPVEAADLWSHVGEVGGLLLLVRRRPAVIGCHLVAAGVGAALLIAGRQIGLPARRDGGIRLPAVRAAHEPGIAVRMHGESHPQGRMLVSVVQEAVVPLCPAVVKCMRYDHLPCIGGGIRMILGRAERFRGAVVREHGHGRDLVAVQISPVYHGGRRRCGEAADAADNLRISATSVRHRHEGLVVVGGGGRKAAHIRGELTAGAVQKDARVNGPQCQRTATCSNPEARVLRSRRGSHSTKRSGQGCP